MSTKNPTGERTDKNTKGEEPRKHFIEEIIDRDRASGKHGGRVATRFPPEPNGYLHIGHAKSICLNFGLAAKYGGTCNLRFDDTNPSTEEMEYVESIQKDVSWLGFDWEDRRFFASDYFEKFFELAVDLVKKGLAYVDSSDMDAIRKKRGDYNTPGQKSPYRDRSVEENLDLLGRMRAGDLEEGTAVLRAKIDMESPNMNLRDPIMYRIRKASHHRTGDKWCIYPMYDFAHGYEDAIEGITHSICTLEFENHRPLYDWFLDNVAPLASRPQQIEFARLNLTYTVMSKRKLLELVQGGDVSGWDDPRMPTISGMRRRGYTPKAIRDFCDRIGVAKRDSMVDVALLEHAVREDLNETSPRVMAVIDPLKLVIENYPEGEEEWFDAAYFPDAPGRGTRKVPFSREIYIERDDFREDAPRKWHRFAPGQEVRLRYACLVKCERVVKNDKGEVVELRCTWDPKSRGGTSPDGRKVKGTSHWVSARHALKAEVRQYDRLFDKENPLAGEGDYKGHLNKDSLGVIEGAVVEPSLAQVKAGDRVQFERIGYYCVDSEDSAPGHLVFNRTVTLKDSWARIERNLEKDTSASGSGKRGQNRPKAKAEGNAEENAAEESGDQITIGTFAKVDLRVGIIRSAELVEKADKLLKLMVDIGEGRLRQVFAGIRSAYPEPASLVGEKVIVVANLKPRQMRFGLSEGMVLAGGGGTERLCVASFDGELEPGDKVS